MNKLRFDFQPLSFISTSAEIKRQIKNTLICRYVFDKYRDSQKLSQFLKSTRYGFTASAQSEGKNEFLRISDIKNGAVDWETVPFCDCDRNVFLLKTDDILVARTGGTTGKSFIVKDVVGKPVFASYLIRLRVNEKLNADYLYLFLNSYSYWPQIIQMKKGSAQPNVNARKLKQLIIPYCDLEMQKKLVNLANGKSPGNEINLLAENISRTLRNFDLINELSEKHDEQIELIAKLRQAILQEALQGKLVHQNSNDEPATELIKRIKYEKELLIRRKKIRKPKSLPPISPDEVPYELPDGWEWTRLGKIIDFQNGFSFSSKDLTDAGVGVIRIGDIQDGSISERKMRYLPEKDAQSISSEYYVKKGDLLIAMSGATTGKLGFNLSEKTYLLNQRVGKIEPLYINKSYTYYYLLTKIKHNLAISAGSAIPNLSTSQIRQSLITIPPLNEQKRIVAKVDQLMKLCDELESQLEQSKQESERLLKAVLHNAF